MRIRLTFAVITAATLVVVACEPSADAPSLPTPLVIPECAGDDDASLRAVEECVWHADRHGSGKGRSFRSEHHGRVISYYGAGDWRLALDMMDVAEAYR